MAGEGEGLTLTVVTDRTHCTWLQMVGRSGDESVSSMASLGPWGARTGVAMDSDRKDKKVLVHHDGLVMGPCPMVLRCQAVEGEMGQRG